MTICIKERINICYDICIGRYTEGYVYTVSMKSNVRITNNLVPWV